MTENQDPQIQLRLAAAVAPDQLLHLVEVRQSSAAAMRTATSYVWFNFKAAKPKEFVVHKKEEDCYLHRPKEFFQTLIQSPCDVGDSRRRWPR